MPGEVQDHIGFQLQRKSNFQRGSLFGNVNALPQLPENGIDSSADQNHTLGVSKDKVIGSELQWRGSDRSSMDRSSCSDAGAESGVEQKSIFEQEIWRLLNAAGTELSATHAQLVENDQKYMDTLKRTNVALKEEIGRLRNAAAHANAAANAAANHERISPAPPPTQDASILHVEEMCGVQKQPSATSSKKNSSRPGSLTGEIVGRGSVGSTMTSFAQMARRFSAGVRSSFQGAFRLGHRVSFAPAPIFPQHDQSLNEKQDNHQPVPKRHSQMSQRMKDQMTAIKRATINTEVEEEGQYPSDDEGDELRRQHTPPPMAAVRSSDSTVNAPKQNPEKKQMRFAESVAEVDDIVNLNNFKLLPTWTEDVTNRALSRRNFASILTTSTSEADSDSEDEATSLPIPGDLEWILQKFIIHPNSFLFGMWECIGYLLIFYDSICLPFQFSDIDIESHDTFNMIDWFIRFYWTLQLLVSFFAAQEGPNGRIPKSVGKVMKSYVRGRFAFDLIIVVADWLAIILDSERLRFFKWLRITRLVRIMQASTMPKGLKRVLNSGSTGHGATLLAVVKNVFVLVWFTHLGACMWYGIGISGDSDKSWITLAREQGWNVGSPDYVYFHAYRWQLSNYVGESGINPETVPEFLFYIFSSILGFVAACICVSSITSAMTRLEIAVAQDSRNQALLRQYLSDNNISSKVATRVVQNAQYRVTLQKRKTPEEHIHLLSLVSEPLKIELHFEINLKVLGSHPLFFVYSMLSDGVMRQVCHTAISRLNIAKGDILFHAEEVSNVAQMFFVTDGKMKYTHNTGLMKTLVQRYWACEPVVWTNWIFYGTARAKTECTLCVLNVAKFQQLTRGDARDNQSFVLNYAESFINHLNEMPPSTLTDLDYEDIDTAWLVQKALPEELTKRTRKHIIHQMMSRNVNSDESSRFWGVPKFFRKPSSHRNSFATQYTGTNRASLSSVRSARSSGARPFKDNQGEKLQLANNIVQNDGPSRRTRIAEVDFLGTGNRASEAESELSDCTEFTGVTSGSHGLRDTQYSDYMADIDDVCSDDTTSFFHKQRSSHNSDVSQRSLRSSPRSPGHARLNGTADDVAVQGAGDDVMAVESLAD